MHGSRRPRLLTSTLCSTPVSVSSARAALGCCHQWQRDSPDSARQAHGGWKALSSTFRLWPDLSCRPRLAPPCPRRLGTSQPAPGRSPRTLPHRRLIAADTTPLKPVLSPPRSSNPSLREHLAHFFRHFASTFYFCTRCVIDSCHCPPNWTTTFANLPPGAHVSSPGHTTRERS